MPHSYHIRLSTSPLQDSGPMGHYGSGPAQQYGMGPSAHMSSHAYEAAREHSQRMAAFDSMRSAYHQGPSGVPMSPPGHPMYRQVAQLLLFGKRKTC